MRERGSAREPGQAPAPAVSGFVLGINPFDQPDVDSAKKKTQEFVRFYLEHGSLPEEKPRFRKQGLSLYSGSSASSFVRALDRFLSAAAPGDYLAIQAFLAPTRGAGASLRRLRQRLPARPR